MRPIYPPCRYNSGYHEMTVEGTPRSAMTYWRCRICYGRYERGPGAFYGMPTIEPKSLEERVTALEQRAISSRQE